MAFVPGFQSDVFISYSHVDNSAVRGEGWVTDFSERLRIALSQEIGGPAQVFRDSRIGASAQLTKILEKAITGAAVMVAIVSPGYLNSQWCDWELKGFIDGERRTGDLMLGEKCRAIKIVKTPVGGDAHRTRVLSDHPGLDFFEIDHHSGYHYELPLDGDQQKRRISSLAQEIRDILEGMAKARSIYLGAAPESLADQRAKVKSELEAQHFRVVAPAGPGEKDADPAVRAALERCNLSIFFVDRSAAAAGSALVSGHQKLASELGLRRMLVVKEDAAGGAGPWRQLDPAAHDAGEDVLLNPPTHVLKDAVLQQASQAPRVAATADALVRVYLVCDQSDNPLLQDGVARSLRDRLIKRGFEVKLPLADDVSASEFLKDNRAKLQQCQGVLLYWGDSKQGWFEKRLDEVDAARGRRRGREFLAKGAYLATPPVPVKQNYVTRQVTRLIKQFDPDADQQFEAFMDDLTRGSAEEA